MVAGDPSQTTPVQITYVFFVLCCCTQIGCVEQHKNEENVCVICTDVVWLEVWLLSPAVASVPHANEAICKLTSWNVHKKYNKHKLTQRE